MSTQPCTSVLPGRPMAVATSSGSGLTIEIAACRLRRRDGASARRSPVSNSVCTVATSTRSGAVKRDAVERRRPGMPAAPRHDREDRHQHDHHAAIGEGPLGDAAPDQGRQRQRQRDQPLELPFGPQDLAARQRDEQRRQDRDAGEERRAAQHAGRPHAAGRRRDPRRRARGLYGLAADAAAGRTNRRRGAARRRAGSRPGAPPAPCCRCSDARDC